MKKAVIISDSFKGTLTSEQVCRILAKCIKERFPECETNEIPVSDGGEGFCECMKSACGGKMCSCRVKNPFFEDMDAEYLLLPDGKTAVIECASCAGIGLAEGRLNPSVTTTFGVGQLMLSAAENGCTKIILGLGGSCTNDCGAGAAAAAGVRFFDENGSEFIPTGESLYRVKRISSDRYKLKNVDVTAVCDVTAPLFGKNGAAYVFAPQKGADLYMAEMLDEGLQNISRVILRDLHIDAANISGGGAAGGLGAAVYGFFGGRLCKGIDTVLEAVHFSEKISGADYIFTGEGKIDSQSACGKVISGVCSHANGVKCIAFTGGIDGDISELYNAGLTAAFSINIMAEDYSVSRFKAEQNLTVTANNVLKLL